MAVTQWVGGLCEACARRRRAETTQANYDAATKIPEAQYTGWLAIEGSDEYHETVDDLAEWCLDNDRTFPLWAWAVTEDEFEIDTDNIIDAELEQHHDEAEVGVKARIELREFLGPWCKRTGVTSLWPDHKRVVMLEPRKLEKE